MGESIDREAIPDAEQLNRELLEERADRIANFVKDLCLELGGDDRFWRFQSIADLANQSFGYEVTGRGKLLECLGDPQRQSDLLANPVAGPLFIYFLDALVRFDETVAEDDLDKAGTAKRREMLADAFHLTGRTGEVRRRRGEASMMEFCFDQLVSTALRERGLDQGVYVEDVKLRRAVGRQALRALFKIEHGCEYDSADQRDKERMRKLKKELEVFGWDFS